MRISTTMQFTNSLTYIQNSNSKVDDASVKYNTGLKFQTAGEDPSGMASKVKYEGAIAAYTQYSKDGGIANNNLSEEETALESMWDALSNINTRLQQCVNGSNDESSLNALSAEIGQIRDHLYDLMNTQNTDGEYIFSGARSDVPTYSLTSDGHYQCQADGASRSVVISPSVSVQVSDSGLDIFENCKTANTMTTNSTPAGMTHSEISSYGDFDSLYETYYSSATGADNTLHLVVNAGNYELQDQAGNVIKSGEMDTSGSTNIINVSGMEFSFDDATYTGTVDIDLNTPKTDNMLNVLTDIVNTISDDSISNEDKVAAITKAQKDVGIALTHYDSFRGQVGARQNTITTVLSANESLSAIKTESKANVSEVDSFEAASDLLQSQNQLSVSRQIYSMLNKQSLFDYI